MGFGRWTGAMFAENFVPLFKLLWGGALLGLGGSYAAMLWLLWLTHALNTALLGRLLFRAGLTWPGVALALVCFALPVANLETLGWSVQWSAILALAFLLAWSAVARDPRLTPRWLELAGARALVLCAAASALCFSRGVLTGGVLAAALLLPLLSRRAEAGWRTRAACLVPRAGRACGRHHRAFRRRQPPAHGWPLVRRAALRTDLPAAEPGVSAARGAGLGSAATLTLGGLKLAALAAGFRLAWADAPPARAAVSSSTSAMP
jgi:hypothetical protein